MSIANPNTRLLEIRLDNSRHYYIRGNNPSNCDFCKISNAFSTANLSCHCKANYPPKEKQRSMQHISHSLRFSIST